MSFFSVITVSPIWNWCAADVEGVADELAGSLGSESAVDVQLGDLGSSAGEHDRVVALRPIAAHQSATSSALVSAAVVTDGDATVVAVGVEGERWCRHRGVG